MSGNHLEHNGECSTCAVLCNIVERLERMILEMDKRLNTSERTAEALSTKMKLLLFVGGILCTSIGSVLTDIIKGVLSK